MILRMLTVDIDLALEFGELSNDLAHHVTEVESDRGMGRIDFVGFICGRGGNHCGEREDNCAESVGRFHVAPVYLLPDASVLSSGVRDSGNLPNKFPSAKAGLLFRILASCTPVIRASSVSKCATARRFGSLASR